MKFADENVSGMVVGHKETLVDKIVEWANDKGITKQENAPNQYMKFQEEAGELSAAINKEQRDKIIDSIGDVQVTLIILAEQLGVDYNEALQIAYDEIKNRKGKTKNGVFVKAEDM